ncbi:DUF3299 domain-containing protein [Pseudomonas saliphila]|uniref:DUF3299 domain-containing protein n=1 Tax=Pseudomonas saliphila TaxID=2586906 RepID=UPI0015B4CE3B|nr:DUF3299 domain-containing protein [Pseudomonas saliphila]
MHPGTLALSVFLTLFALTAQAAEELSWDDLIPPEVREIMEMAPPVYDLADMADGLSDEDFDGPLVQIERSAPVVAELNGREVKLPGYIVPLGFTAEGEVNEFLLVPYFGACIHVPPPPSNQTVYVKSKKSIKLEELYEPFWVTGAMQVEHVESELANAGYKIVASVIEPYVY